MLQLPGGKIELRDEGTRRTWSVELASFALDARPVTRGRYVDVFPDAAVSAAGPKTPVTEVSWFDALRFCNRLSELEGRTPVIELGTDRDGSDARVLPGDGYRLPTEAEWEHACRAGSEDVRPGPLDDIAWHRGNSDEQIHSVGTRQPNAWGLYDMIGNAWEWCWDIFDADVYGAYRVFRGGGWLDTPRGCRASCRRKSHPTFRIDDLGFRVARSIENLSPEG
ncbi:MAG: formylglycine-generating enzyme family protein [Nannocystaceae bacterium]|nr:formylglycine-generating enzyme family protein [Nannocystaceae bacterium]